MKLPIIDAKKAKKGDLELPKQFSEPVRRDLIQRAVFSLQAAARQPYGADPDAGMRVSAKLSRRRRNYRGSYGQGISRVPRKVLNRRGIRMYYVGALAPGTVGGRRAHPPKAEKVWAQKINKRENRKAIRSALAAVMDKTVVAQRGHKLPAEYPFILDNSFESIAKTKDAIGALLGLGFADELARAETKTVRAGKAKMRGRKTKRATSLLLVVGDEGAKLAVSAANIPGVTIVPVRSLNAELLAPGTHPGRATLFTEQAMTILKEESLFADKPATSVAAKPVKPISSKKEKAVKAAETAEKTGSKPAKNAAKAAKNEAKTVKATGEAA